MKCNHNNYCVCVCVCVCVYINSKCYHSLVQLVMGSESTSDMAAKEQAWSVLEEVLRLMDQIEVMKNIQQ